MQSNGVFNNFVPAMDELDAMIHKLEVNLGMAHSTSEFKDLRTKYGAVVKAESKPAPIVKAESQPAPAEEKKVDEKKTDDQPKPKKEKKEKQPKAPKGGAKAEPANDLSDELNWFNNCDLRVGKIVEVEICDNSEKLYIEKVDLGEGSLREIGSGLRQFVTLDEMKKDGFVVVFANLKPRKLAHIMSQGMVLCASNGDHTEIEVMRPPAGSKLGERIFLEGNPIEGFSQDRVDEIKNKKKQEQVPKLLGLLKTNGNCEATYNGIKI
jgi:methionine--tRNA ligase beta chain